MLGVVRGFVQRGATPSSGRDGGRSEDQHLAGDEQAQPEQGAVDETVGVEADAQHVGAEPGPTCHDVSEDSHGRDAAGAGQAAPAGVQDQGVPKHDQQRAIFLRVPAPERASQT